MRLTTAAILLLLAGTATAETSLTWGVDGELFDPGGRLMDWSYVGYGHGEASLPFAVADVDVTDFGAVADDVALVPGLGHGPLDQPPIEGLVEAARHLVHRDLRPAGVLAQASATDVKPIEAIADHRKLVEPPAEPRPLLIVDQVQLAAQGREPLVGIVSA